jgi:photosystem I subunit 3
MKNKLTVFITGFLILLALPKSSFAAGVLVDCDKSPAFAKRQAATIKKLEARVAKYEVGTPPYLALKSQIDRTNARFKAYGDSALLCGADGLPHLIVDGDFKHAGEFMLPGCLFLYTTGWIGWAGRKYLGTVATSSNPSEKEIIIDVPLALKIMLSGYLWPVASWQEFISGDFIADPDEITVSPR